MINKEYFSRLAYSYFSGKITKEERTTLNEFISMSEENALLFREVEKKYIQEKMHDTSLDKEFETFVNTYIPQTGKPAGSRAGLNFFNTYKYAFLLFFILVPTMWIAMQLVNTPNTPGIDFMECYTSNGEIKMVILPDSTEVVLNAGSVLLYPSSFNTSKREIYVNGEAYLNVKKDKERPFIVHINELNIEVLGTSFNVSSYAYDLSSSISLIEGAVDVVLKSGSSHYQLIPDEKLTYYKNTGEITHEKTIASNSINWINGDFVIERLTLTEIIPLLERRFNKKIYQREYSYKNAKLTVKFTNDKSLEYILDVIQKLLPEMKYEIDEEAVFFL